MTTHKDRRTALLVFGIIEILLGGLCLLGLLFAGMGAVISASQQGGPTLRLMVPGLFFYLLAAAFWVWIGIGSLRAHRWARALMLVISWLWLITGIMTVVVLCVILPRMLGTLVQGGDPMMARVMLVTMIFSGFFYGIMLVVMPLVFLLFYRSQSVKATCEAAHPEPCWTDRCPLPILALSIILFYGAISCLISIPIGVIPVFGRFVTGVPGAMAFLLFAVVLGWLAYAVYRVRIGGWWGTLVFICLGTASALITFVGQDLGQMYAAMGMDEAQLELLSTMDFGTWMPWQIGLGGAAFLVFHLYVLQYFRGRDRSALAPPVLPE